MWLCSVCLSWIWNIFPQHLGLILSEICCLAQKGILKCIITSYLYIQYSFAHDFLLCIHTCRVTKQLICNPNIWIVGGTSLITPASSVLQCITAILPDSASQPVPNQLVAFFRLQIVKELYYSSKYGRVSKQNSYTVSYLDHSKQKRFGFIQYYLYINGTALVVINPLGVNSTPQVPFQLPSSCAYVNDKIVCVNIDHQCDIDVVTVDKVLDKCLFLGISADANYVCTINTVIMD